MASKRQSLLSEIVKYGVVGGVSTVIDIVILNVLKGVVGWPLWLAVALGFLAGTVNGYYMNSRWTFNYNTRGQEAKKFSQFVIVSAVGLGLTELIVNGYVQFVNLSLDLVVKEISPYNVGKLLAVALVFFWNFGANKLWTFNSKSEIRPSYPTGRHVE